MIKFRGSNGGRKLSSCLNDGEEKLKEKSKEESWCLSLIKPPPLIVLFNSHCLDSECP